MQRRRHRRHSSHSFSRDNLIRVNSESGVDVMHSHGSTVARPSSSRGPRRQMRRSSQSQSTRTLGSVDTDLDGLFDTQWLRQSTPPTPHTPTSAGSGRASMQSRSPYSTPHKLEIKLGHSPARAAVKASSTPTTSTSDTGKSVRVFVRVRPPTEKELQGSFQRCLSVQQQDTVCMHPAALQQSGHTTGSKSFSFDRVFGEDTSQEGIAAAVGMPMASAFVRGFCCTVFAYGQTGSGKTFTMQGPDQDMDVAGPQRTQGLMPRMFKAVFEALATASTQSTDGTVNYCLSGSFLEIYNDRVYDLLQTQQQSLALREHGDHGVYVEGLKEGRLRSPSDAIAMLRAGVANRRVGETNMNRESSRSHSVLTLTLQRTHTSQEGVVTTRLSKLNLVDLAGSERQTTSGTCGARLQEAAAINQSLSTLGKCIHALSTTGTTPRHVPYRDSRLTYLLKDSLGGRSMTCVIACVSPARDNAQETVSTLQFARRAKRMKNRAIVVEDTSASIEALLKENKRLKRQLQLQATLHQTTTTTPADVDDACDGHSSGSGGCEDEALSEASSLFPRAHPEDAFDAEMMRQCLARERQYREQVVELQQQLSQHQQLHERMEKQKQSLQLVLNFRDSALAQATSSLAKLRSEAAIPIMEWELGLKAEVERLQKELSEAQQQLLNNPDSLRQALRIGELESRLQDAGGDSSDRAAEVEELRLHNLQLTEEVVLLRKQVAELQAPLTGSRSTSALSTASEQSGLDEPYDAGMTHPVLHASQPDTAGAPDGVLDVLRTQRLHALETERTTFEAKLVEVNHKLKEARVGKALLERRLTSARQQLDTAQRANAQSDEEIQRIQGQLDNSHYELARAKQTTQQLKRFLEMAVQRADTAKQEARELQQQLKKLHEVGRQGSDSTEAELNAARDKIDEQDKQLEHAHAMMAEMAEAIQFLETLVDQQETPGNEFDTPREHPVSQERSSTRDENQEF